jgi:hypothetical protein
MSVCTEWDTYINDFRLNNTMWFAELSNGEKVLQDDDRPGEDPPSAWVRLVNYCNDNGLHVKKMYFSNGDGLTHPFEDEDGLEGAFFMKGVSGDMFAAETSYSYIFGNVYGDQLRIKKYTVPDCQFITDSEVRQLTEDNVKFIIFRDRVAERKLTKVGHK